MTTPYDITLRTGGPEDPDPDHAWIELSAAHDPAAREHPLADVLTGYRWIAGILGRLALSISDNLADERTAHLGCHRMEGTLRTGCHIEAHHFTFATPDDVDQGGPTITINIPPERLHHWTRHIKRQLNELTTADAWQPTAADEYDWRGETPATTLPIHLTAPQAPARTEAR